MKIKAKIQSIITAYIADKKKYEAGKFALETSTIYSAEYKGKLREEMDAKFRETCRYFDDKLNAVFQDAIDEIKGKRKSGADFHTNVTTALSYIGVIGDNITDRMAFDLVHPLLGDLQTMNRFYLILSDKLNAYTDKTMLALAGYVDALDALKAMQSKFKNTFSKFNSPESPAGYELLGTSPTTDKLNEQMALDAFQIYTMRGVDSYERHMEAVEKIYSTPFEEVEELFSDFPLPIKSNNSGKIQTDPLKLQAYFKYLNGENPDFNILDLV